VSGQGPDPSHKTAIKFITFWTPDERRRLQWRNKLEYRYSTDDELGDEIEAQSGLTYQLGEAGGQLLLLRLQGEYREYASGQTSRLGWFGIEFNPW